MRRVPNKPSHWLPEAPARHGRATAHRAPPRYPARRRSYRARRGRGDAGMALPYDLLFLGGFAYAGKRIFGHWLRFSSDSGRAQEGAPPARGGGAVLGRPRERPIGGAAAGPRAAGTLREQRLGPGGS